MITNIQVLRFFAALSVAVLHAGLFTASPKLFSYGTAGVDVFFVISGFIMVLSSKSLFGQPGAPSVFMVRRLQRIVPLYWLATLSFFGLLLWNRHITLSPATPNILPQMLAGLFFIPFPGEPSAPLIPVGWSLNSEMLFYVLFALFIRFREPIAIVLTGLTICLFVWVGSVGFSWLPQGGFVHWFGTQPMEFVFGMLLGYCYARGIRLPPTFALILAIGGLISLIVLFGSPARDLQRYLYVGLPAAAIVYGATCMYQIPQRGWLGGLAIALGDASYALYLVHWVLLYSFGYLSEPALLIAVIILALAVNVFIEKPVLRLLRRRGSKEKPNPPDQLNVKVPLRYADT